MMLKDLISVPFNNDSKMSTIQAKHDYKIIFLGASCPIPLKVGDSFNSISVAHRDDDYVMAVQIRYESGSVKKTTLQKLGFILKIIAQNNLAGKDDNSRVVEFIPLPNALASISDEGVLSVLIAERRYWWNEFPEVGGKDLSGYVSDPNLLCRFMIGKVTADEVNSASIGFAEERQARKEIPAIKETLGKLKAENDKLTELVENKLVSKSILAKAEEQLNFLHDARLKDLKVIDGLNDRVRSLENDKTFLNEQIQKYLRTLKLMSQDLQGRFARLITPDHAFDISVEATFNKYLARANKD